MSFLAPLFLLGGLAVALPVLFHLIRRSSRERVPFSSLMFLLPTPPRVTRRSKLENVLLLILRCLVIALLAFAFARPYLSKPAAPDPKAGLGQRLIVLIDRSASMRRAGLWSEAKTKAAAIFRNTSSADQVACYTFERELHPVVSFEQWVSLPASDRAAFAAKQLDGTEPSWGATRLGSALISASEMIEAAGKEDQRAKRIVMITDLQEGSRLDGLQGFEWPRDMEVGLEVLKPKSTSNAGLQLAGEREQAPGVITDPGVRVRVSNASDSKKEQFQVGWRRAGQDAFVGPTVETYVPPGQSRVVLLPRVSSEPGLDRIGLAGDDESFDNTAYVVPPKAEHSKILFLSNDSETNSAQSLYYLRRAFQDTRKLAVQVSPVRTDAPLSPQELGSAALVIVDDLPSENQIAPLKDYLQKERAILLVLKDSAMGQALSRLTGLEGLVAQEAPPSNYAMLGQINFEHPLFAPFADPRYSDFTKIHFWKHRTLPLDNVPSARVLARFDNGDPALAEIPVGKGRVWVLTSGWQPEDSQLALSSKFVPLLYAMLEQSGGVKEQQQQYVVGDVVTLPVAAEAVTIRKPDTSEIKVGGSEKFNGADQPGIYSVGSGQTQLSFAVNLAPEESKTGPLAIEEFERLGVPLHHEMMSSRKQIQERQEHLQAAQLENRQKLWRWLIVAAVMVLMIETWLAGRLTRRAVIAAPEAT